MADERLHVFLCGPQADELARTTVFPQIRVSDASNRPLHEVSAAELNTPIRESTCEFVALSDATATLDARALHPAIALSDKDPKPLATLLPVRGPRLLGDIWFRFPTITAALAYAPEAFAMPIIPRSAFEQVGPFDDVARPVWQWLVRAAQNGGNIHMADFNAAAWQQEIEPLPALVPQTAPAENGWLAESLHGFGEQQLIPDVTSQIDAVALKAGLFQVHDYLNESHNLAQSVEGRGRHSAGDYWHAVMHRREPDYSNSKYWFRRVGQHPVFEPLAARASALLSAGIGDDSHWADRLLGGGRWDAFAFVDLCQYSAQSGDAALTRLAEQIQLDEMLLLLLQTFDDARSA